MKPVDFRIYIHCSASLTTLGEHLMTPFPGLKASNNMVRSRDFSAAPCLVPVGSQTGTRALRRAWHLQCWGSDDISLLHMTWLLQYVHVRRGCLSDATARSLVCVYIQVYKLL